MADRFWGPGGAATPAWQSYLRLVWMESRLAAVASDDVGSAQRRRLIAEQLVGVLPPDPSLAEVTEQAVTLMLDRLSAEKLGDPQELGRTWRELLEPSTRLRRQQLVELIERQELLSQAYRRKCDAIKHGEESGCESRWQRYQRAAELAELTAWRARQELLGIEHPVGCRIAERIGVPAALTSWMCMRGGVSSNKRQRIG